MVVSASNDVTYYDLGALIFPFMLMYLNSKLPRPARPGGHRGGERAQPVGPAPETLFAGESIRVPVREEQIEVRKVPVAVEEITIDPPGPGEVLVKLAASGMCRRPSETLLDHAARTAEDARLPAHLAEPAEDTAVTRRLFERAGIRYLKLEASPARLDKKIFDEFVRIVNGGSARLRSRDRRTARAAKHHAAATR